MNRVRFINSWISFLAVLCFSSSAFAGKNDFIIGNWTMTGTDVFGADASDVGLNFNGKGKNPFLVIRPQFLTGFSVGMNKAPTSPCVYTENFPIGRIDAGSTASAIQVSSYYYDKSACASGLNTISSVDATIKKVAKNKDSFTICLSGLPTRCMNFKRKGDKPKLNTQKCSKSFTPPIPTIVKKKDKTSGLTILTFDHGWGFPNTYSYSYIMTPTKIPAGSTAAAFQQSSAAPVIFHGMEKAAWKVEEQFYCGPNGTQATSKKKTFNVVIN